MENQTVNILIVDDRQENLLALEAVLMSSNYSLVRANSGDQALKMVLQMDFAVILMDVQMPGMNGFETAKLIKSRDKSKEIPIVFITALSQSHEHVMHGYRLGAIDYIFKPFDPEILRSKVHNLVKIYLHQQEIKQQRELLHLQQQELEEAYSKIRSSEELARVIAETSIDTIVTMNSNGVILKVNPAVQKMFHYEDTELFGKRIDLLLPFFLNKSLTAVPEAKLLESEAVRKDGTVFPADYQICVGDVFGGFSLWICTIRDISARKQQYNVLENLVLERTQELVISNERLHREVEEKQKMYSLIKESEEKYRQLVEESPEAIIVRKMDEDRWSFINQTGLKLLGAETKEQVIGKSFLDFIAAEHYENVRSQIKAINEGKKINFIDSSFVRLDGEVIDVQIKLIPFIYHGERSLHIVVRDMTELKKSREIIENSDKLTMVGELAAGIAHEIRNPLTSLRGFVQLLANIEANNKSYTQIMISEVDRINSIVGELLLLSKPVRSDFEVVEIIDLVNSIVTLLEAQANLYGVMIETENTVEQDKLHVLCEDNKIKQVLINILKNAIEAMPGGGKVTIRIDSSDAYASISFKDHGAGIPEDVLSKVGKPFFTTKEQGTGLGLMISRSIIENHKGHLDITSQVGVGTTVTINLPIPVGDNRVNVFQS
jgi:two-component system, sporulation sensor kinase E